MAKEQRLGVSGMLVIDDKVLLVQRHDDEDLFPGVFELPGGGVELGEHPDDAVVREFKEETGLDVRIIKPYKVFSYVFDDWQGVEVLYLLELVGDFKDFALSSEHDDAVWAAKEELFGLKTTPEVRENVIAGFVAR